MSSDINLNRLGIFKVVASLGSFSKAALTLKQPKSRISRNITALEKEMGVSLIYRTTRQFQLTAAGVDLYQKVVPHLSALENVIQSVDRHENIVSGLIRMTVPNDVGIELMAAYSFEFQKLYPQCKIDLLVDNKTIDLVSEGVDVALRFGALRDSTLKLRKLGWVQLKLFISPNLLKLSPALYKISDLEKINYVSFKKFENKRNTLKLTNQRTDAHLKLVSTFSSDNFFVNKQMAILGSGFCVLPAFLAKKDIQNTDLVQIFKEWSTEKVPISLLMPQQKTIPLRLKLFIEFLELKLKDALV